jgi:phage-related protein
MNTFTFDNRSSADFGLIVAEKDIHSAPVYDQQFVSVPGRNGDVIKKIYDRATADDTKREVVETCVKAVEQIYQELSGTEKLEKAKENIIEILNNKGIAISEIEMDMLIEACVAEFNLAFLAKAKEEKREEKKNGSISEA